MTAKVLFAIPFYIFLSSNVYSSDALYCTEEKATGFDEGKNMKYEYTNFKLNRFSMKFSNNSFSNLIINRNNIKETYTCKNDEFGEITNRIYLNCIELGNDSPYTFLYAPKNKRFTYIRANIHGYLAGGDSMIMSIGTCDDF